MKIPFAETPVGIQLSTSSSHLLIDFLSRIPIRFRRERAAVKKFRLTGNTYLSQLS